MIGAGRAARVFAYGAPIDLRKGFEALSSLVTHALGHELLKGDVYLFVGRRRRGARVLYFDGTGLCILSKRLLKGRFAALWSEGERGPLELTQSELLLFLEGCELVGKRPLSPAKLTSKDLALSPRM